MANKVRTRFRCVEWIGDRGCLIDRWKFQYQVTANDLVDSCEGQLDVGEYVSGVVHGERVINILSETGPRAIDRIEFEKGSRDQ